MDKLNFIDSHAHLFDIQNQDNINLENISGVIVPSYNKCTFDLAMNYANKNTIIYKALGIHPQYCENYDDFCENYIISNKNNIVAIGEIGLDDRFNNFDKQLDTLHKQLNIAKLCNLPVIIHLLGEKSLQAFCELYKKYLINGVVHSFIGDTQKAKTILDLGLKISFACNITYKRHKDMQKTIEYIPISDILLETDSPSTLPSGFGRTKNNTPNNIIYVAQKLAEYKNLPIFDIAELTTINTIDLFNLRRK